LLSVTITIPKRIYPPEGFDFGLGLNYFDNLIRAKRSLAVNYHHLLKQTDIITRKILVSLVYVLVYFDIVMLLEKVHNTVEKQKRRLL